MLLSILVQNRHKKTEEKESFNLKVVSSFSFTDICYYKKVCPFNGSTPMIQSNTSDFHFSWNQMPNAIGRLPRQHCLGPTLPMLLAWPELAVAMETPCVAIRIQLGCVIIRVILCVCICANMCICVLSILSFIQKLMESKHSWYIP